MPTTKRRWRRAQEKELQAAKSDLNSEEAAVVWLLRHQLATDVS